VRDGTLARYIADGVRGVTANPAIFARAIKGSAVYDEQFSALMACSAAAATSPGARAGAGSRAAMSRAAVVVNPTKLDGGEGFRAAVRAAMADRGWSEPLWLETTADDPGEGLTRKALQAGVDLVLACGGDGTVAACAAAMAGSGIPLAVLPAGTGNLLALNLGLPMGLDDALVVGLTGSDRLLDVGSANGKTFVVMAGLGFDAKMLDTTSDALKKRVGWPAYGLSALAHLQDGPMRVTVRADGGRPVRRRASGVIIGNVGWLQGGVPLLPDAEPDDGWLDVVVLTARGVASWLALAAHVLLRRRRLTGRVLRIPFRELRVDIDREQLWELDGEVMGRTRQLVIAIAAGKLTLRVPAAAP
jgi:diacylglycerol kinase family enzyme